MTGDQYETRKVAAKLEEPVREANALARKLGLEPYQVNYWIVDYDEMNALIAYDGFQTRYPHWRWGMKYEQQKKQTQFLGGKAFEIVNNDNPSNAFLQVSNSLADQKAVITHVEAHADFFRNNRWFRLFAETQPNAAAMLARHAETIGEYMADPDIDRSEIEAWIDSILCLEDNIDQHRPFRSASYRASRLPDEEDIDERLKSLNISEEVLREVFDEEWLEARRKGDETPTFPPEPEKDLLAFLWSFGKQFDEKSGKARDMEEWQRDVLEILRRESYYFAPQKMTKVMNEGWAAYWESVMMGEEHFAGADEFISYADHQAKVLGSPGLNPYKLGKELWEYVENTTNRAMVAERLLRIDGVTWRNFHDVIDFDAVMESLQPDGMVDAIRPETLSNLDPEDPRIDAEALEQAKAGEFDVEKYPWKVLTFEGLAERHFSLVKQQNQGFVKRITQEELERFSRYMFDDSQYADVGEALADVDFTAGWDRMFEIRESHNDVTFLDEFLTQEFVDENHYFTYEYVQTTRDFRVTSVDHRDVKKKLMLQFTNFGRPTVLVLDGNYNNRNELLLGHRYNGVMLDLQQAKQVIERVFDLWGRPVCLKTIVKEVDDHAIEVARRRDREPEPEERGKLLRYDGESITVEDLPWEEVEHIAADDIDYDTKPKEWLA
ncbi:MULTISPECIES: SpoVR family protein [unclassified Haladaptatus]|uniref:SpoVR family protein n=1 Tax=unclassified Haladaptatus TaxID=2622732 RepID=UPI0023E75F30|nr:MULTISPECIES: SpoVR family protein [unclassified Haladaptatus]